MRLGLDFGTTNSAIAVYDGEQLHTIAVDRGNDNPQVMPSLVYINRRGEETVGAQAAEVYLRDETGRRVRWRVRDAGEVEITVASFDNDPIEFVQNVNVLVDIAARGRLLQSIKTALFNVRYEGTRVFRRYYRIDDLIAVVLRALKAAAERELDHPCEGVTLGRPVIFARNPAADSRAEAVLLKAAHLAGFRDVDLQLEPVGVVQLYHRSSRERQVVLVFDFGGGTLDLTIARVGGDDPPEILATGGARVGGDDLDRAIMRALLPHFGGGDDGVLPPELNDRLRTWQTMPELSQPRHLEQIRRLQRESSDPTPLNALETLVTRNVGYKLFKEIETVKQQLSEQKSTVLRFHYDNIAIEQPFTRRRFESLIASEIDAVADSIDDVMQSAGMQAGDIDVVLRTGGSSLVPVFYDLLANKFDADRLREIDPLVSVVGGFALAAYEREQNPPPLPPKAPALVRSIASENGSTIDFTQMRIDTTVFTDRDYTVVRIPFALNGLPAIRTANADRDSESRAALTFELKRPARVYVAYESTAPGLPDWLRTFTPENMQIEIEDSFALIARVMAVYGKDFPAGTVTLGGAKARGYQGNVVVNYLVLLK